MGLSSLPFGPPLWLCFGHSWRYFCGLLLWLADLGLAILDVVRLLCIC